MAIINPAVPDESSPGSSHAFDDVISTTGFSRSEACLQCKVLLFHVVIFIVSFRCYHTAIIITTTTSINIITFIIKFDTLVTCIHLP